MAEEQKAKRLEIAHVLFMDIVGYSKLLTDEQSEALQELNQIVRSTEVVRQAEAAARAARQASEGSHGRLHIGYPPGPLPMRLAETVIRFAARFPFVEVVPEAVPARQAVGDVSAGRLDVAVVGLPVLAPSLTISPLSDERVVAAVPHRHPLSGRRELDLRQLAETPLIVLPRADNPAFHDSVLAACRSACDRRPT